MKLYEIPDWKAVHFKDGRTILKSDYWQFSKLDWEELIYDVNVEPMQVKGHYKAV